MFQHWFQMRFKAIADPAFVDQIFGVTRVFFNLAAQMGEIDMHVVDIIAVFFAPHLVEQGLLGDDLIGILQQIAEQTEFGGCERNLSTVDVDAPLFEIDCEIIVVVASERGLGADLFCAA